MRETTPRGSSTPNFVPRPTRRRNLHDTDSDAVSPIGNNRSGTASPASASPLSNRKIMYSESDESVLENEDSEEYLPVSSEADACPLMAKNVDNSENNTRNTLKCAVVIVTALCIPIVALYLYPWSTNQNNNCIATYDFQRDDIWISLDSGLSEVSRFNKPSVFLFLYKEEDEEVLNGILRNFTSYASCMLNKNPQMKPIVLDSSDLSRADFQDDYGRVIMEYKTELERKSIMVIKNLDQVPGTVAPAFHSLCDYYSPLVGKSLFLFTIKVKELPEEEFGFVEKLLRRKWNNIKSDHFGPLLTRLSGMILKIIPK